MHRQIWAPPLPLGRRHTCAHLSCWDRGGQDPQDDAHGTMPPAHPRDRDAEPGARRQQPHFLPRTHQSSLPACSSSVATAAAGRSLLKDGMPAAPGFFFGPYHLFRPFQSQAGAWGSLNFRRDSPGCGGSGDALAFPSSSSSQEESSLPIPVLARGCHDLGLTVLALPEMEMGGRQPAGSHFHALTHRFPTSSQVTSHNGMAGPARPHAGGEANRLLRLCRGRVPIRAHRAVPPSQSAPFQGTMGMRKASAPQHGPGG